jgi:alpha-mannosidase
MLKQRLRLPSWLPRLLRLPGALPEGSRAVIVRLSNLRVLPDGVWKMHSGDLAHGEAVNLDESGWKAMEPQTECAE